jgi:uncharacterized protein Usg
LRVDCQRREKSDDERLGPTAGRLPPDHGGDSLSPARPPRLLQSYIWQALDIAPRFPVLQRFLTFWERNIEGRLHSVKVCSTGIVKAAEFRVVGSELRIH